MTRLMLAAIVLLFGVNMVSSAPIWMTPDDVRNLTIEHYEYVGENSIDNNYGTFWGETWAGGDVDLDVWDWGITYDMVNSYEMSKIRIALNVTDLWHPCRVGTIKICDDLSCSGENNLLTTLCELNETSGFAGGTQYWYECDFTTTYGRYVNLEGGIQYNSTTDCLNKSGGVDIMAKLTEFDVYGEATTTTTTTTTILPPSTTTTATTSTLETSTTTTTLYATTTTTTTTTTTMLYEKDTLWWPTDSPTNYTIAENMTMGYGINLTDISFIGNNLNLTTLTYSYDIINVSSINTSYLSFYPTNGTGSMSVCSLSGIFWYYTAWQSASNISGSLIPFRDCVSFGWNTTGEIILNGTATTTTTTTTTTTLVVATPETQSALEELLTWIRQLVQLQEDEMCSNNDDDCCQMLVSNASDYSSIYLNRHTILTEYTLTEYLHRDEYWWKVRCKKQGRWSPWSETWMFNHTNSTTGIPLYMDWTVVD